MLVWWYTSKIDQTILKLMKVLFVIESIGNGGAERMLINTIPYLEKIGVACEVALLFEDNQLLDDLLQTGVTVHELKLNKKWGLQPLFNLKQIIENGNYDVIHAHLFFAHFYIGILKQYFNITNKTVVALHNLAYKAHPVDNFLKKIRKKLDNKALKSFDKILAVSNAVSNHFTEEFSNLDIEVLHNGFPTEHIKHLVSNTVIPTEYTSNKVNIITPGRLVVEKGHKYLLDAIKIINFERNDLFFFIAGDGPERENIESCIRKLKLDNVKLLGNLPQPKLFKYINYADLVLISSISEGFPMIVGECMVLGKPIVSTNAGGIPDFIENEKDGLLVPIANSKALAEATLKVLNDKILRENIQKNAIDKAKLFDMGHIAQTTKNIYQQILNP